MAGEIARASAGITAPSQGSFAGDVADTAGAFLSGIQEEKERKEKQALEDARLALEVRAQEEVERSALILEEDRDFSRAVQQDIADAQLLHGEAAEATVTLARDRESTAQQSLIFEASGLRQVMLETYGIGDDVTGEMDAISLRAFESAERA